MTHFFDALCSSWLIAIPICLVLFLFVCLLMFRLNFENKKLNTFILMILVFSMPAAIFIFSHYAGAVYGFGYVDKFEASITNKKWICLVSEGTFKMHTKGGGSDLDERLHIIDIKTGERVHRDVIGYFSKFIRLKGDTLLYKSSGSYYTLYNVNTGTVINYMDRKTLAKLYKELSPGVEESEYDEDSKLIKVTAKNGKTYYLDPFTMKLLNEIPAIENNESHVTGKKEKHKRELFFDYVRMDMDSVHTLLLENKNSDDKIYQLMDADKNVINKDLSFLYGTFLANVPKLKRFLVLSYETTDKDNFIVSCISNDYKLLWKFDQKSLDANDFFSKDNFKSRRYGYTAEMDFHKVINENLIITIQGFVYSINLNTGNIDWKTRL